MPGGSLVVQFVEPIRLDRLGECRHVDRPPGPAIRHPQLLERVGRGRKDEAKTGRVFAQDIHPLRSNPCQVVPGRTVPMTQNHRNSR